MMATNADLKWWQRAVFYQIYPRSFADGNGDGIGDFRGMTSKLGYLRDLGIDAIWLSPHYPSPFLDCGYDISDFTGVAPEHGTLDDFVEFLNAAHRYGIRVVLDLVLNHSSDQHPWFQQSRSSRDNPKRDWYIWRDGTTAGKDGLPPNNWASIFGGSAWEYDAATDQYYYHAFLKEQPDLNWRNPEVKQAMWDAVRFWLDLGVDGFRLDAIATIFEHPDLPNHALNLSADAIFDANRLSMEDYRILMQHQIQQPGVHELMQEMRGLLDTYPDDRVLIGEDEDVAYHGPDNNELHLVFNFPLMRTERLTPAHIRANQLERLTTLPSGAWPCNTLGNHDGQRVWSRYGNGKNNAALARLHCALMLTLKGTPFLYNGEEIGMSDLELTEAGHLRDSAAINQYRSMTERGGHTPAEAFAIVAAHTRDRCRSPLHWSDAPNAGFSPSEVQPWLPVHANFADGVSVAAQLNDPASLLSFYRRLLHLRRNNPALYGGDYQALSTAHEDCLVFVREDRASGQRCLVALNFSDGAQAITLEMAAQNAHVIFSSEDQAVNGITLPTLTLKPFEVLIAVIVASA